MSLQRKKQNKEKLEVKKGKLILSNNENNNN